MSRELRIFPRRYHANSSQHHTLIGLTIDETIEFERLDQLSLDRHSGEGAWDLDDEPTNPQAKRWLELYRKHETGWSIWLAAESGTTAPVPVPQHAMPRLIREFTIKANNRNALHVQPSVDCMGRMRCCRIG